MKSWSRYIPLFTFAFGVATLGTAIYVFTRGFDPAGPIIGDARSVPTGLIAGESIIDSSIARPDPPTTRPDGLTELSVVEPDAILMTDQRAALMKHLAEVRVGLKVPDAMSYAPRREGKLLILAAASGRESGFYLFSERRSKRLATGARKFLVDYFRDAFVLSPDARDEEFQSRFAGKMNWIRGTSATGRRFDAFVIAGLKPDDYTHLLFILDPTVANATRRLMVDSVRLVRPAAAPALTRASRAGAKGRSTAGAARGRR